MTVTDNRATHLTYTQARRVSNATDSPGAGGAAAIYTAPVTTSAAMTVSVSNSPGSGSGDVYVHVQVLTDTGNLPTASAGNGKANSANGLGHLHRRGSYTPKRDRRLGLRLGASTGTPRAT
jgi:hypothetical protein